MIEVILFQNDRQVASAEADTAEDAVFAARTIWREHEQANRYQGVTRAMRAVFYVDGTLVRMVEGRLP